MRIALKIAEVFGEASLLIVAGACFAAVLYIATH